VSAEGIRRAAACLVASGFALAALAGCAQAPVPDEALSAAELTIARARAVGAERHAPVELARAEEKLQAAQAAVRANAPERARTLAEQASVDAELAETQTQAAQAQAIASQLRQQVEQQPRRLARGGDGA
jgi:uncharacterized protein YaiL (DUF2058 family)